MSRKTRWTRSIKALLPKTASRVRSSGKSFLIKIGQNLKKFLRGATPQIVAIIVAFLVGAIVLAATGYSPLDAYARLLMGAFGDSYGIGQTLAQATPIIFTSLAFLFAFKCGLFNIGAEGQLLIGGMAAALVGISFTNLPIYVHLPLALLAGAAGGALWAFVPAVLKAKLDAHEVITTLMLSYVALYVTSYLVNYPFIAPPGVVAQTPFIASSAELPRILPPTQLSGSIIVALAMVGITAFVLQRTTLGYEVRAVGLNATAARSGGINVKRGMILALVISGTLAGLGGAGEILGVERRFIDGFSPGYGWDGLAVALIGGLNPFGAVLASILIGALRSGGLVMNAAGVPFDVIYVVQSLVVLFAAAPQLMKSMLKKRTVNRQTANQILMRIRSVLKKSRDRLKRK